MPYPANLLPQPASPLLTAAQVPAGWLLRRTDAPTVFLPQTAPNGRPLLRPDQLGSPAQRLPEGLSVNLLGQFAVTHAAWEPTTQAAKEYLRLPWPPGQAVIPPTPADMHEAAPGTWDAYVLDVAEVENYQLDTVRGVFEVHACHAPNCWNYWHYEVRFLHTIDGWAHAPGTYSSNQMRKVGEAIRQSLQTAGLAQPLTAAAPALAPSTAPPTTVTPAVD
ncbi:hypothetical protein ACW9KT_19525 [Hymenobacter sp. HD11105]